MSRTHPTLPSGNRAEGTPPKPPQQQLPSTRRVLGWIYIARLALLSTVALLGFFVTQPTPQLLAPATALLVLAALLTAASYGYSHSRGEPYSEHFLYAQVTLDAFLVTAVVHLTGAQQSSFAFFYILVICAGSLLLPRLGGLLIGLLTIVLYIASVTLEPASEIDSGVFLLIGLFAVVTFVTTYLGDRLQKAGTRLGEVQIQLQRLRLDTTEILGTIGTGVITVDGDGRLAFINPAGIEILALDVVRWRGQPVLEHLDEIAPGFGLVIAQSQRLKRGVRRYETSSEGHDQEFVLGVSTTLLDMGEDETPAVTAIFQDITERKRADELRRRAERLQAVAELSASLAHEIRNPLASIRSAVEQITGGRLGEEDHETLRNLVLRESDRLSRLLTEFIDFARVRVSEPAPLDLHAIVEEALALVRAHPEGERVDIQLSDVTAHHLLWLNGDEDLLHRAVLNLALNAAHWSQREPGPPQVRVTLDAIRSDLLAPAVGDRPLIRLTVADSGPGVPEDVREQIFDPFFTSRKGGTGLGLALVHRAVEAHGGAIFVDNAPGGRRGAMFTLYFPAVAAPEAPAADATLQEAGES